MRGEPRPLYPLTIHISERHYRELRTPHSPHRMTTNLACSALMTSHRGMLGDRLLTRKAGRERATKTTPHAQCVPWCAGTRISDLFIFLPVEVCVTYAEPGVSLTAQLCPVSDMEASLTCAVCLSVFRDPVTLPVCCHNFCKSCVLECGDPHSRSLHFSVLDGSLSVPAQVTCPLCRKVSSIPGGLSALPVNTTLAELVRLLSLNGGSREQGAACGQEAEYSERGAAGRCPDHPEHKLELFCKNCAVPCCGKCVSCNHQGIFHNVNLLDMVYQEEKLTFFNSLKKLREIHEQLTKSTSEDGKEVRDTQKKNTDIVNLAFNKAYKALELKKTQCLEFVKQQQNSVLKRHEVRQKAMAHQKVTVGNLLKDSESLVDEFDPKCFLQMACGLNKRMTSNLDLMDLTVLHDQDVGNTDPINVDLQAVLDAISAVNITACASNVSQPKFNGISFKTIPKIWKHEQAPTAKYSPVQSQELCYLQGQIQKMAIRLLAITEMPEYKHLSFEELRMKHYGDSVIQDNIVSLPEQQGQTISNTENKPNIGAELFRLSAKMRKSADLLGACSSMQNKQQTIGKSETNMEITHEPQKDAQKEAAFMFPTCVVVRAKEPAICPMKGTASGVSLDHKVHKETEMITSKQEPVAKTESKMVTVGESQKNGQSDAAFRFPTYVAVRAKEPVISSVKGAAGGLFFDNKMQKSMAAAKEISNPKVVTTFCFGKSDAIDLTKPSKKGKLCKKPKTSTFLQTTVNAELNKPFITFTNTLDSVETKATNLFYNPLSQQEFKSQGIEESSFPEEHTAQSSSCEEFYDAKSDAEETDEQARPSNSTG